MPRESYGEDIVNTETEESTYGSNEEKYESDFIDDDEPKVFPSSPVDSGQLFHLPIFLEKISFPREPSIFNNICNLYISCL